MEISFHGVRGSYPVPGMNTNKYGGNTSCVSFSKKIDEKIIRIIVDMGTGAIDLGKQIIYNYLQGKEDLQIFTLFTHLHPDHTQAFPFFAPNYFSNCTIHLLGMETLKKNVGTVLKQEMLPPTFPIEYSDLKSTRVHHILRDGETFYIVKEGDHYSIAKTINEKKKTSAIFKIDVMQSFAPSHPQQGCLYYRITDIERTASVACIWDLESHQGGDKRVINFSHDCDIMIHDTQYTLKEYNNDTIIVQGFGHSTYEMAIENATQAGIKQSLLCTHFNPAHCDQALDEITKEMKSMSAKHNFSVLLAREGMTITV